MARYQVYLDTNLDIAFNMFVEENGGVVNKVLKRIVRERMMEEGFLNGPMGEGERLTVEQMRVKRQEYREARRERTNELQRTRRALNGRKRPRARRYEE